MTIDSNTFPKKKRKTIELTLPIRMREGLIINPEVEIVTVLYYRQAVLADVERIVEGALVPAATRKQNC